MDAVPATTSKKNNRSIFAITSLVLGILDLPILFCGFIFALVFGMGDMIPPFIISLILPVVICLGGLALGFFGLRSPHKWAAIIGIVLPAIYLSIICMYFFYTIFLHPGAVIITPTQ
jgi:hypothetical protein